MTVMPMPRKKIAVRAILVAIGALTLALVTLPRLTGEAADPVYTLVASNWDGGGGRLSGGGYTLESSIGQPDAGRLVQNAGGPAGLELGYALEGGFQHMQLPLDTNCDDSVNAVDALFSMRNLAGLDAQGPCSLDANRDTTVNLNDVLIIRRSLVGLP